MKRSRSCMNHIDDADILMKDMTEAMSRLSVSGSVQQPLMIPPAAQNKKARVTLPLWIDARLKRTNVVVAQGHPYANKKVDHSVNHIGDADILMKDMTEAMSRLSVSGSVQQLAHPYANKKVDHSVNHIGDADILMKDMTEAMSRLSVSGSVQQPLMIPPAAQNKMARVKLPLRKDARLKRTNVVVVQGQPDPYKKVDHSVNHIGDADILMKDMTEVPPLMKNKMATPKRSPRQEKYSTYTNRNSTRFKLSVRKDARLGRIKGVFYKRLN